MINIIDFTFLQTLLREFRNSNKMQSKYPFSLSKYDEEYDLHLLCMEGVTPVMIWRHINYI